jgi:ankyrin repeat protein
MPSALVRRWNWNVIFVAALLILVAGCTRDEGMTRLMIAAHDGNLAGVRAEAGDAGQVNRTSAYGWTALMFAAWKGYAEITRVLLDAGADPNIESGVVPSAFETVGGHPRTTALREATRSGHLAIARLLIQRGAHMDPEAVALAAGQGDLEFLEFLREHKADFDAPSRNAFAASPLCAAAAEGKTNALTWLLDHGAAPNLVAVGQNPLGEAAKNDYPDCVHILLERGANPNLNYGVMDETPLFEAVTKYTPDFRRERNLGVIRLLLAHGAEPARKVWKGKSSPLEMSRHYAQQAKVPEPPGQDHATVERSKAYNAHQLAVLSLLESR